MNLKPIGPNATELTLDNGNSVLFSYETAVAAFIVGRGLVRSSKRYSATTSRHVSNWLDGRPSTLATPAELGELAGAL